MEPEFEECETIAEAFEDFMKMAEEGRILQRVAEPGEVYAFYVEMLGKYGACQVLAVDGKSVCYVLLNYLKAEIPKQDMLGQLRPYYREAFRNHHQIIKTGIENTPVPRDYWYVGRCELKSTPIWDSYSWKWSAGEDYYYEERWRSFDEKARSAYKKYINSGDFVCIHGQMFKKNTGGLRDELYQCLTEKDTLNDFPCITYAEVQGYSGKLAKLISTATLLRTLRLKQAGVEFLDLSKLALDHLELDMGGIRRLVLPKDVRFLKLYGEFRLDLQIDDSLCTGKMDLEISLKKARALRYGLGAGKIRRLRLTDIRELDMEQIAGEFSEVEHFSISGSPGSILHMGAVGELHRLRSFYCKDLFGYSAEDMEAFQGLQELREMDFDSVSKEAGQYVKKHWKKKLDRLSVLHLRDDGWLKDNLENPLRHWEGNEFIPEAAYRSAGKCWKDTKKKLLEAGDRAKIQEIIRGYTRHFNKLNDRYEKFIETEEREDIFMAMQQLYEDCVLHGKWGETDRKAVPLTLSEVWDVMDEVRENW